MLLRGAECVFMGFILFISGVRGNRICALKGSSVDLHCSAQRPDLTWFNVSSDSRVKQTLDVDGKRVKISEDGNFTLTINDLRESDQNRYCCCRHQATRCQGDGIQLLVADLQVEVFPARGKRNVSLMCSSSCPLTETPADYIWYKNSEFLYQDWSPWYQELISTDGADTYSCAVTGHEHLRAPEVSLDSLTSDCFTVTYARGRMCSHQQRPDEPCSITFPRELHVKRTSVKTLYCKTSCPQTKNQTITWYKNRRLGPAPLSPISSSSRDIYSCAVRHLISDEVCMQDSNCLRVSYDKRRICALRGSSVNIYTPVNPKNRKSKSNLWYKMTRSDVKAVELLNGTDHIEIQTTGNNHILIISKVKKKDSAKYIFTKESNRGNWSDLPGVTLVVTELEVKFTPSAEVTEGQRVTLTCKTSCPLTDDLNYIWYLNNHLLNQNKRQSKHLVLDPVSSEHAGNYSCSVEMFNKASEKKTLTVHQRHWAPVAIGVVATLLVIIPITVFLCIRRNRTLIPDPTTETSDNLEQISPGHEYASLSAQPTEEEDALYSSIQFPRNTDVIYSKLQLPQPAADNKVPSTLG